MQLVILPSKPPFIFFFFKFGRAILSVLTTKADQQTAQINYISKNCLTLSLMATICAVVKVCPKWSSTLLLLSNSVRDAKCGGFRLFYEESLLKSWGFGVRI